MSRTVDEKVVEMQFDNRDFERNVSTSISTLQRLKDNLDFSGVATSFDSVSRAASKLDFSGLTIAVEAVTEKFTALEVMAISALNRITNEAITMGTQFVKSLGFDQITAGFTKFEEKTQAVQTIMSATGLGVDEVNEKLEKLAWFSDETSYSFIGMVNTLGKFTSAGVDIDHAISALTGLANEAAASGQNAETATRAMEQLAQAIGSGVIRLQDWASIESANMATYEFKQNIIETAEAMGLLTKYGDKWAASDPETWTVNKNTGVLQERWVTPENMRDWLSEKWFTSDVLISVLRDYGKYSDAIYEIHDAYDECSEAMEAFDKNTDISGDAAMLLSQKAFKAGQVAKTFTDAVGAVKDAVSSGWMKSFEIVIGNFDEASALWTDFNSALWEVFASSIEARNELLQGWKDFGGRDSLLNGISQLFEVFLSLRDVLTTAFHEIFPEMTIERLVDITKKFEELAINFKNFVTETQDFGESIFEKIWKGFNTPFESKQSWKDKVSSIILGGFADPLDTARKNALGLQDVLNSPFKKIPDIVAPLQESIDEATGSAIDLHRAMAPLAAPNLGGTLADFSEMSDITEEVADEFAEISQDMDESVEGWSEMIDSMANEVIRGNWGNDPDRQKALEEAGYDYYAIQNRVNEIIYGFEEWHAWLGDLDKYTNEVTDDMEALGDVAAEAGDNAEEETVKLRDLPDTILTRLGRSLQGIIAVVDIVKQAIDAVFDFFGAGPSIIPQLIWEITGLTASFGDFLVNLNSTIREGNIFGNAIQKVAEVLNEAFWRMLGNFESAEEKVEFIKNIRDTVVGYFNAVKDWVTATGSSIKEHVEDLLGIKGVEDPVKRSNILWDKYSEVMGRVRSILGGVVSAFKLLAGGVKTVFTVLQHPIQWLTTGIGALTNMISGFAASIGESFSALNKEAEETGFFENAIKQINETLGGVPAKLNEFGASVKKFANEQIMPQLVAHYEAFKKNFLDKVHEMLHPEEKEDGEEGPTFLEKVVTKFQEIGGKAVTILGGIFTSIGNAISGMWNALQTSAPTLGGWLVRIGDAVVGFIEQILKAAGNVDENGMIGANNILQSILGSLLGIFSGTALTGIFRNIKILSENVGDAFLSIRSTFIDLEWLFEENFDQIRAGGQQLVATLKAHATADMLKAYASAMLMLAGAILVLSFIPEDRLLGATAAMTGLLTGLTVFVAFLTAVGRGSKDNIDTTLKSSGALLTMTVFMLSFAIAASILAGALKKVSKIPYENVLGYTGVFALLLIAIGKIFGSTDTTKMVGSAAEMIAFSVAVLILVKAMTSLHKALTQITDLHSGLMFVASLATIMGMMVLLSEVLRRTNTSGLVSTALSIVAFAAAVGILVDAVKNLASFAMDIKDGENWGDRMTSIFISALSIAGLMVALGYTLSRFPQQKALAAALAVRAVGITVAGMVDSVIVIAKAFSDESLKSGVVVGIATIAAFTLLLGGIMALGDMMDHSPIDTGVMFLGMGAGITLLAIALKLLSSIPIAGLISGIASLVVTIGLFAGAAALFNALHIIEPMRLLAEVLLIFGAACIATGIGLELVAAGLIAFSAAVVGIAAIGGVLEAISYLVAAVIAGIIAGILDGARIILESFGELVSTFCDVVVENAPKVAGAFISALISVLTILIAKWNTILILVGILVYELLKFLESKGDDFGKTAAGLAVNTVVGFAKGLFEVVGQTIDDLTGGTFGKFIEGVKKILGIKSPSTVFATIGKFCMEGFGKGVEDNKEAATDPLIDIFGGIAGGLGDLMGGLFGTGEKADEALADGVESNSDEVTDSFTDLMDDSLFDMSKYSPSFYDTGSFDITKLAEGFGDYSYLFNDIVGETALSGADTGAGYYDDFYLTGNYLGQGLNNGLKEMAAALVETADQMAGGALAGISAIWDENSPSRAAFKLGVFFDQGLINGMLDLEDGVYNSSVQLGSGALDGLKGAIERAGDISEDELTFSPKIRPVVDMSDVTGSRGRISSLLNSVTKSIDIAGDVSARMNAKQVASLDGIQVDNRNVVDAITAMRGDISSLSDAVQRMQIVMDTGTLVGAIAPSMDNALGRRAVYAGRGI